MEARGRSPRRSRPRARTGLRGASASLLGLVLSLWVAPGCRALREASDRGQRILESPGVRPGKVLALVGAIPGAAVGVPLTAVLVPTLPFPGLVYPASPEQDISMPVLFAPLDIGIGLGAFILSAPLLVFDPDLGTTREPSEWPAPRPTIPGRSPGLSDARTVETPYPPPAPPNPSPLPPEPPPEAKPPAAPEEPAGKAEAPPPPPPPPPPEEPAPKG